MSSSAHLIASGILFVRQHPAIWPALFFPFFWAGFLAVARSASAHARFHRAEPRLLAIGGGICLGLYALSSGIYLCNGVFHDVFESTQASVTSLFLRGDAVYAGTEAAQRYGGPYGPALYLALGSSQAILGPSVFSTKLPGVLAAWASLALFWRFIRRQHGAAAACAFAGLAAALLLAFRLTSFWAKPDPLILLCVTLGLCAARREGWGRVILLGACVGIAVDLKPHAAAYFLPVFVIAYVSDWRRREFAACGAMAAGAALLPFLADARQFPLENYVGFLCVTAREGFGRHEALGFCRWVGMLAALIYVAERLTGRGAPAQTAAQRRARIAYRVALALASLLVATPAAMVGADQHHLIPLIPLVLIAVGDQFARRSDAASSAASAAATARLRRAPVTFWRSTAYAALAACALISVQTLWRVSRETALRARQADAYLVEIRQVLDEHSQATLLMGVGDTLKRLAMFFRHEPVFAGNPVGIDAAAQMDYQKGGLEEPDLGRLLAEMDQRHSRPVWWVFPRGAAPFSAANFYDAARPAYSKAFRQDFHQRFELREQTRFFDLYAARRRPPVSAPTAVAALAAPAAPLPLLLAAAPLPPRGGAAANPAERREADLKTEFSSACDLGAR